MNLDFGLTEERKQKYPATMSRGDTFGAIGIAEADAGTDAASIQTTAVLF